MGKQIRELRISPLKNYLVFLSTVTLLKVSVSPQMIYWGPAELTYKNTLAVLLKKLIKSSIHWQDIKEARVLERKSFTAAETVFQMKSRNLLGGPGELGIMSYPQSFGFNGKGQSCFNTLIKCWSAFFPIALQHQVKQHKLKPTCPLGTVSCRTRWKQSTAKNSLEVWI